VWRKHDSAENGEKLAPYALPFYTYSKPSLSWSLPISPELPFIGRISYTPSISLVFNYGFSGSAAYAYTMGQPLANLSQSVGFSHVDWIENHRKGLSFSLGNSNSYNLKKATFSSSISAGGQAFLPFNKILSAAVRVNYFYNILGGTTNAAADVLRGVFDNDVNDVRSMLSFNFNLPISVFRFMPSEWFGIAWMRYFNFEFQLSPIIDVALLKGSYKANAMNFTPRDALISAGLEAIIYPLSFRSYQVRVSAAWSLMNENGHFARPALRNCEYSIGLGLFF
jgi:hypothetical protein